MDKLLDAIEEQKAIDAMKKAQDEQVIRDADTTGLIYALYTRGVSLEDIEGRYYEFTEQGNGRMTNGEPEGEDF